MQQVMPLSRHGEKYIEEQRGNWQNADIQDRTGYICYEQSLNFHILSFLKQFKQ